MYDDNGGIVLIGQVASIGTAYPLMTADGCLFAGGHHEVFKYTVKDGKIVIAEEAEEVFDTAGNATYYYSNDPTKNEEVPDNSNLTRLFDEYFGGEVVEFSTVQ